MSGICGIIQNTNNHFENNEPIQSIHRWNLPYGSACSDVVTFQNVSLGCHLEHITNTPITATPVLSSEDYFAVIDAILYNRQELLQKCSAASSLSDEELLFSYITAYGFDALKEVNGDFAGAVYDNKTHTISLFRDHMGIRPLYYYFDNSLLAFSTDMRGLLSFSHIKPSLNEAWLYKRIAGYPTLSSEETELANIFCVPPSGYITFSCDSKMALIKKEKYWALAKDKIRYSSSEEYITALRELVTDSVNRRLSVFPGLIGAELSGGLDSGVIDILINRSGRDAIYHSWSANPEILPYVKNDERLVITDICKQENITCHYCGLSDHLITEFKEEYNIAKNTVAIKNKPITMQPIFYEFALPPHINTLPLSITAEYVSSKGAHVVFSGHGGDEGISHRAHPYELFYHHEYYHFLKHYYRLNYRKKFRIPKTFKHAYESVFVEGPKLKKPFIAYNSIPELFQSSFRDRFAKLPAATVSFAYNPKKYVLDGGSRSRLDVEALLGALSGVRYVTPYLDYRVINFALSIPRHLYFKGRTDRYIFREAFKDILPNSLYHLNNKWELSRNSIKQPEDWYETLKKEKEYIVNSLIRSYWENYLDYKEIHEWLQCAEPSSEEEKAKDSAIMQALKTCLLYQNMLIQVRGEL